MAKIFNSAKLLTLLATGIALVSPPALSQGAMGPGGPAAAPQPRAVAPAPQAPQAPIAPTLVPTPPAVAPVGAAPQAPRSGTTAGGGKDGKTGVAINGDILIDDPTTDLSKRPGAGGPPQARSGTTAGGGKDGKTGVAINGDILIDDPTTDLSKGPGAGGRQQERSKAPLPAGYGYDATGRIVYTGR